MSERRFAPGFRFSVADLAILAGGAVLVAWAPRGLAILAGTAVGHFFFFCNVFRMSRKPELIWATTFTALSAATLVSGQPGIINTVMASVTLALLLVALEMRKPHYHGVGWQTVNPRLPEWWQAQHAEP